MKNNTRFELSFKNIIQLENKLNFCKLNNIKNLAGHSDKIPNNPLLELFLI